MQVTTLGIDLAKNVVQVHGIDAQGHVALRKRFSRAKVLPFLAQLPRASLGSKHQAEPIIGRVSCRSRGSDIQVMLAGNGSFATH